MIKAKCRAAGLEPIVSDEVILLAPLPAFWEAFAQSKEFTDGAPDPLDRYSKSIIDPLANALSAEAAYPSDGPPYAPFITWALAAEGVYLSPIGLLVHDQFGLFVSFRGALKIAGEEKREGKNPCETCAKPCETTCPVGAFSGAEYDVDACKAQLHSGDVACWQGCLARQACPANHIARNPEQSAFSMRAFAG